MKFTFLFVLLTFTVSAFATDCSSEGAKLSEQWVRESVEQQFGSVKIEATTSSSASNIYTRNRILCHHTTVYTFKAFSQAAGKVVRFMGYSVMNDKGERPFAPILSEVKEL